MKTSPKEVSFLLTKLVKDASRIRRRFRKSQRLFRHVSTYDDCWVFTWNHQPFETPLPRFPPLPRNLRHRHGLRPRVSICGQCTLLHEPRPFTEGPRNATVLNNLFSQGSSTLPMEMEKTIGNRRDQEVDTQSPWTFFRVSNRLTEWLIKLSFLPWACYIISY